jgi:CHASE3 domain sensor protein
VFKGGGNSGTPAPWVAGPIWIAFSLVLLTLAVVGTASYRSTNQLASSSAWVAHTHTVILGLEGLRDVIDGAESAERGYILRGDRTMLEAEATARTSAARIMKSQGQLTADNPAQQRRLLELGPLVEARISLLEKGTAIRTQLGRDAATDFSKGHDGPALMTAIHARVETMIEAEDQLLKQRGLAERRGAQFTLRVLGIGALAELCFVALAAVYIQRTIARLRQATELAQQRTNELARSESALRAQSALQKSVFEAMGEGVIVAHRSIPEPTLNPAARRILAIDDSTVWSDWLKTASIWREAGTPPLAPDETPFARLANDSESGEIEMLLRQPATGALIAVAATATRLLDESGMPGGL